MLFWIFIAVVVLIEAYYWFWWLPRNWRKVPEAKNAVEGTKFLYGKDGKVWDMMKNGEL